MKDVMCKMAIVGALAVYGQVMYKLGKKHNQEDYTLAGKTFLEKMKDVMSTDQK